MYEMKKNDLHGDGACLTKLLNPDNGAVTGIAEKGECLFPAVAQSAAESIGERR